MVFAHETAWGGRGRLVAGALGLASFLTQFDVTSVVVVMPAIGGELGIPVGRLAWVIDAYSIAFTVSLLVAGALADRFGRRRSLLVGNAGFLVASLVCGVAPDASVFLGARAGQGVGAAFLVTGAIASIGSAFPSAGGRARAFGVVGVVSGAAMALGPSLGGVVGSVVGWRWIFLANVPCCVLLAVAVPRLVGEWRDGRDGAVDWGGVGLLTLALGVVIDALLRVRESGWGALVGLGVGAGLLVVFGWWQRGRVRPLLDPAVFGSRAMVGVGCVLLAVSGGYWAVLVYLPLFLGRAFGWGADVAGVALLAATVPMLVVPPFGARLARGWGWRRLFAAALGVMAVGGLGLVVAAGVGGVFGVGWASAGMVCLGVGAALSHPQLSGAVMALAPAEVGGMASAVTVVARQGGFALGVALLGGVVPGDLAGVGFVWVFGVAAFVCGLGVGGCFLIPVGVGRGR